MNFYAPPDKATLRRPVEPKLDTPIEVHHKLALGAYEDVRARFHAEHRSAAPVDAVVA